ncbi:uncharacterized protein [Musca autumnalis]|uniref:uncharacterized protein n=1 Tax=Musca autumnalis TaxID=221902 RepID=UPI003CFA944F
MSDTITLIKEDENHMKQLLKNQTSIINSTLNIFKQDELQLKENFDSLDYQMNNIEKRLHENEQENHQFNLFQNMVSLSSQLTLISVRLHRIQTAIITTLSDSHHGKISPMLLSPLQLQSELIQVRNHLPPALQLPVRQENLLQLYKIMNVKGGITENHIIFYITIPLCDPESLELLKLHPIPAPINSTMMIIRPCSDLIAITAHRDEYYTLTEQEWAACTPLTEDEVLCPNMQSKFNADAAKCLCEISLLNNITRPSCSVDPFIENTSMTQLKHGNQWMYTMSHQTQITTVCNQEHSRVILQGTGLIKISSDCTLKYRSMFIQGHQTYSSSLHSSYTATANVTEISYPDKTQYGKIHLRNYIDHIKNISEIQNQLHQQVLTDLPLQLDNIKRHHATVAYAALILAIGIIITALYKRRQFIKMEPSQQPPIAAVRQNVASSEFVISVS